MYIKPQIVCVVITRDMAEKTAKPVYVHEIKLLEAVHGAGKVSRDEKQDEFCQQLAAPLDALEEYMRCESVYGMHPAIEDTVVHHCYGDFEEGRFVKAAGGPVDPPEPKAETESAPVRPSVAARKAEADARRAKAAA